MTTKEAVSATPFRIKLFGLFRETAGSKELEVTLVLGHTTVADLKKCVHYSYPALSSLNMPFLVAVNRKVADDSKIVKPEDEIALLPLISGG
jgi:molybdopterin converting factor small subunit